MDVPSLMPAGDGGRPPQGNEGVHDLPIDVGSLLRVVAVLEATRVPGADLGGYGDVLRDPEGVEAEFLGTLGKHGHVGRVCCSAERRCRPSLSWNLQRERGLRLKPVNQLMIPPVATDGSLGYESLALMRRRSRIHRSSSSRVASRFQFRGEGDGAVQMVSSAFQFGQSREAAGGVVMG